MLPQEYQRFSVKLPLEHVHTGIAIGNGFLGLSVWGQTGQINITLGCSALWDHRGCGSWQPDQTYANVCQAVAQKDEKRLRELFPRSSFRPTVIPLGRIVLDLPESECITLHLTDSLVTVEGKRTRVKIRLSQQKKGLLAIRGIDNFQLIPAYDLSPILKERNFNPPQKSADGFLQPMPDDPAYGVNWVKRSGEVLFQFFREKAVEISDTFAQIEAENRTFWESFWSKVPEIHTGDPAVDQLYYRGIAAFQYMTADDGFPAGLQGPWIEDDQLPPWSSDYHFNINVQMCYWPACRAGLFNNLKPLWNMIAGWKESMRFNAKCFVNINDGYMLPHAVDDKCVHLDGFWPGTIDHTSAGWMAIAMFEYIRYSGDEEFLREFAFDFMCGVMRVYEAMLTFDGEKYAIPCQTSPEYYTENNCFCGRNPSFHLAAIHRLLRDLFEAAGMMQTKLPDSWLDIQQKLPQYSRYGDEIALWEGLPLEASHRHHSHLAGICPFDSVDIPDEVVKNSINNWIRHGMGAWAGWSLPWAAMIHTRCGNPEMTRFLLNIWPILYTNKGGRTLHDPNFPGFSVGLVGSNRIMQMDAGMGITAAILDCFLYEKQGVLELFGGFPQESLCRCKNIYAPGGMCFSGSRNGFSFTATRSGTLHLRFPQGTWTMNGKIFHGKEEFKTFLAAGDTLNWLRMDDVLQE